MRLYRNLSRSVLRVSLFAAFAGFAGCINLAGGDGGAPTAGTLTVIASNQAPKVGVNVSDIQVIRIIRSPGYNGNVTLGADSVPLGVTATFEPSVLGTLGTISVMTLTAAANAVAGTTLIKIKATGQNANIDSTNVNVTVVTGALALATSATNVVVPAGATGSVPLTITRSNGFLGPVSLSVEGLPASTTATFTPALLPNGTVTSTLSVAVAAGTAPTSLALTVRAKGTGVPDQVVPLQLTVASTTVSDFSLSASPASHTLVAGTSGTSTVTVPRTGGFAANVGLTLSGAPAGLTYVFSPNFGTDATSTLTLFTTTATAPGDYNLLINGAATVGAQAHSIPLSVRITPTPAIAIRLIPDSLKLAPSGFAQSAIVITRIGGFTGDINMTATGLPTGVTATFGSTVVLGTATTLTLSANATAAAGVYNVVIRGTAGSDSGSATLVLTVGTVSN